MQTHTGMTTATKPSIPPTIERLVTTGEVRLLLELVLV